MEFYKLGKYQSAIDYFNRSKFFDYSNIDDGRDEEEILSQSLMILLCKMFNEVEIERKRKRNF